MNTSRKLSKTLDNLSKTNGLNCTREEITTEQKVPE
jgi:hypothetical protein